MLQQLGNRHAQHSFAQIPAVNMQRSSFDRSHQVKDTFSFDYLIPFMIDEIIPGDTVNIDVNSFSRLTAAAQKNPVLDNAYMDFFFFFVPNRLVWNNWEKFCGAQDDPGDSTSFLIPSLATGLTASVGSIYDKMEIPTGITNISTQNKISALPFRAYNLIWNQWFRDQNLQDSLTVEKGDGPDATNLYQLKKRGKRHDYFTSSLPWPQKGTAVDLPLGLSAPVLTNNDAIEIKGTSDGTTKNLIFTGNAAGTGMSYSGANIAQQNTRFVTSGLYTDLSSATAATINQLREAWQIQSILELDARGGTRYTEILQSHFQVTSPDFRLQRPEYLGGGSTRLNSHIVAQTSPTSGSNALGQLAAFTTQSTIGKNIGFSKSFVEHGYLIGLVAARTEISYQQGLDRLFAKQTRYDFFWPKLQELGEQPIYNYELMAQGTSADDDVFGYQERYAEYRFKNSKIKGQFRSTYATPLDSWHYAEEFSTLPSLNSTFIESSSPVDRTIAVAGEHILFDCWVKQIHARPMLTYSVPSTIGRF